ncbi:putative alpha/beta hydrolase family esterase [Neorhizobium galegae]|uniref:RBBP9/YdeN family alpha/beta hydrolase n=1 Tax=Neorhizobium galegae TaxID=399 RepID=UPI001AE5151A|nr:alpha/beta fold hydrolase [Neorhizobium galegae]MBP2548971.1 putative alpha/beta hydrolase family esterase [Neorhizobium galegae]
MVDTLILPGLNGSGEAHWQRIWSRERPHCRVLEQENWACPDLRQWRERLEEELSASDSVVLVAHSLGCILAASLAWSPYARKIRGALLVAPCDMKKVEELHPCAVHLDRFPDEPLPFPSLVIGSANDPYMDPASLQRHSALWGTDVKSLGAVGHINIASGFGRWSQGYTIFDDFIERLNRREPPAAPPQRAIPRTDFQSAVADPTLSLIPN